MRVIRVVIESGWREPRIGETCGGALAAGARKDSFPMSSEVISESAGSGGRIGVPELEVILGGVDPEALESVVKRIVAGQVSPAMAASRLSPMAVRSRNG